MDQIELTLDEVEETVSKREVKIDLKVDEKKTQEAMKNLEEAFVGIKKKFESIGASIRKSLNDSMKTAFDGVKQEMEAVLGIHIGDADIARATERYQRKMAVVNGRPY